jgi:hypothetical protein
LFKARLCGNLNSKELARLSIGFMARATGQRWKRTMTSALYTFYLNKLHINSKTSPGDYADKDVVVFAVIVNGQIFAAPASNPTVNYNISAQGAGGTNPFYTNGYIGLAENGNDIELCIEPQSYWRTAVGDLNPIIPEGTITNLVNANFDNLPLSWAVGPLDIAEEDNVTVFYSVVNISYFSGNPTATYLNVAAGELATLGGIVALMGGLGANIPADIIGGVIAAIGGVLALFSAVISDIDPGQPNCNGPILISLPQLTWTGAQLEQTVSTLLPPASAGVTQFFKTTVDSGLSEESVPQKCVTPSTDVYWSIARSVSTGTLGPTPPPGPGMMLRPLAVSNSPEDWDGMWGDGEFFQNSRITCVISSTGNGVTGATPQERIGSYVGGLIDSINLHSDTATLLGQDPRVKRAAALSIRANAATARAISPTLPVAMPVGARYTAAINEHLVSSTGKVAESISAQTLAEIPMAALPLPQSNVYPPALDVLIPPVRNILSAVEAAALPTMFAATLVASADVSLHLYGQYDSTGKIAGHRIRYFRTSDAGFVVTDVMLSPVQNIPT